VVCADVCPHSAVGVASTSSTPTTYGFHLAILKGFLAVYNDEVLFTPAMVDVAQLEKTRQTYRAQLSSAVSEDEDPLAAYERFVKWTIDNYPPELIPNSGLLELLEEAIRQFKDDESYKGDLRYTKLWMLYAAYVDDNRTNAAGQVYKYLVQNSIGTVYAQVYEEYAAYLERAGRCVTSSFHRSMIIHRT
jgi:hypothetical protein